MVKKKNIHVLPTDKPSRLTKNNLGKFIKLNGLQHQEVNENQHIYITSDEEIKEGDWFYDGDGELCKYTSDYVVNPNGWNDNKKIILTTDQDLIKDGVQKIADDFLEWFIKNPNCEKVEIRKEMYMPQSNGKISDGKITHEISLDPSQNTLPYYKIIIPKEPKQKTLEKLAKEYYPDESKLMEMMERIAFKRGYTECEERMYSEAIEFAEWIRIKDFQTASKDNWIGLDMKYYTTEELFEQFKKK